MWDRAIRSTWREWAIGRIRREHSISWREWKREMQACLMMIRMEEAIKECPSVNLALIRARLQADTGAE